MDLNDYIKDNAAFWQDVDRMGLVNTFNKWFLFDNKFAELAVEYVDNMSMPKPQDNWNEYSKAYVEGYLYDPDSLNEEPPEDNSKDDNEGYCVDSVPLPF